ncbi:MAG: ABC transporter substrate-binding protein [Spirochaetales bacterium]|nr:ABC transporter substrate-binding protein [Spirochaetales bacterium]
MFLTLATVIFAGGGAQTTTQASGSRVIGISKIVAHPALDAVEQGIQDELTELGFTDLTYDLQNANGEASTAASIASKFQADRVALAIGIATPTAQALVNNLRGIPVIYSAVTDPIGAGLVESEDRGGEFVTGISDLTPVKEQLELLVRLQPSIRRIGHVYSSGEANAVALADLAKAAAEELGLEFIGSTVANSAEVRTAAQSIVNRVDAYYVSTDNTVVSAMNALLEVAANGGKPVMSADPSSAEDGGVLAAWGFDYYKMGRATGRLVSRILNGEAPASIGVQYLTDPNDVNLVLNLDVAKELGISVPQDLLDSASVLIRNGQLVQQ